MNQQFTGKTIAKLRKTAGLTQSSLAGKLGVSDKAISKWERGIACPDVSLWNKLSILLDTDIESLIYGHEGKSEWKGIVILDCEFPVFTTVYDKPLIHYLISPFLLVGITDITIVGECKELKLPGVEIRIAKTVNQRFSKNVFVIYGNSFIYGPNLTKHIKRAMSQSDITVLVSMKHKGQYPITIDEDKNANLTQIAINNQYFAEPYFFFSGENEVNESMKMVLRKQINAETMARGMACFSINSFDKALALSQYIRMMEELTDEKIGCVEEIIIRRGIANYGEVIKTCNQDTREYLSKLFQ